MVLHYTLIFLGIVEDAHCADQYLVKYWQQAAPNDYQVTKFHATGVTSAEIKVVPRVEYDFQVQ